MKKHIILFIPLLFILLQRCNNEDALPNAKAKVSFSLSGLMNAPG